jgi:hypothetical protein
MLKPLCPGLWIAFIENYTTVMEFARLKSVSLTNYNKLSPGQASARYFEVFCFLPRSNR